MLKFILPETTAIVMPQPTVSPKPTALPEPTVIVPRPKTHLKNLRCHGCARLRLFVPRLLIGQARVSD
jgi:hypothetical protein